MANIRLVERRTDSLGVRMLDALRSYTVGPLSLKDPALAKFFGGGRSTAAGITVSDEMAFTMSAVFCAVDNISSDVAKVPLVLRKRGQNGGSDDYTGSRLYELMRNNPNPDMTSFTFRKTLIAHALTCHGGYAEIERDGYGMPAALWILTPNRVEPIIDKIKLPNGRYRGRLKFKIDGGPTIIDSADMIHIHGLGYDGYSGYSTIDKARQAIGLALAAERFGASFFSNGSVFGGVLSTDLDVAPDKEKDLRANIAEYHGSSDKAHRMLFLSGGWKYMKTGVAPNEAQMDELRDKQCMEVARFFNFPLYKLKVAVAGAQSFASNEQADLDYFKGPLLTMYVNCEQEYNSKLIPAHSSYSNSFFKHNVTAFMRGDAAGRTALYTALLDRGVYCADDVLELEDQNPQPGGIGKLFLVQGAMVPKDKLGAMVDASIEAKKQPKPAPASPPADVPPDQNARALDDAVERARLATELAATAEAEARAEREARITLEATGTAQAGEIIRLAESERAAIVRATDLAVAAAGARSEVEALRAVGVLAAAELEELRATVALERGTVASLTDERDRVAGQLVVRDGEATGLTEGLGVAQAALTTRTAELEASRQEFSSLNQRWVALEDELRGSQASQDALQATSAAAVETSRLADDARQEAERRAAAADVAAGEARAAVARCLQDVERIGADRQADRTAREAAEALAAQAVEAREAANQLAMNASQDAAAAVLQSEQARAAATAAAEALAGGEARIRDLEAAAEQASVDRQAAVTAWAALDGQRAAAVAEVAQLAESLAAADTERAVLRQAVTTAEAGRSAALEAVTRAEASLGEYETAMSAERSAADVQRATLEQRLADATGLVATRERELQEATTARDESRAFMLVAEGGRAAGQEIATAALAELEAQRVGLERRVSEQATLLAAAEQRLGEIETARQVSADALRSAEEVRTTTQTDAAVAVALAEAQRLAAEQRVEAQAAELSELQRQLVEVREADARGVAAMIAAHRGQIIYKMQGLVEFETDRLRRSQATPEKLRAMLDSFYETFADRLARALVPDIAAHLAFIRSDDDPRDEARRFAEGHVRESRRQLELSMDNDPEIFGGSMTALWHRWESERSAQIADVLMERELSHARGR